MSSLRFSSTKISSRKTYTSIFSSSVPFSNSELLDSVPSFTLFSSRRTALRPDKDWRSHSNYNLHMFSSKDSNSSSSLTTRPKLSCTSYRERRLRTSRLQLKALRICSFLSWYWSRHSPPFWLCTTSTRPRSSPASCQHSECRTFTRNSLFKWKAC